MLADIYEEQGEVDKAIAFLENIPVIHAFSMSKGYATYRLSRLYEKSGLTDKALAKCNLLIKDYADCDEKYKPWVEEVTQRRDRLMARVL